MAREFDIIENSDRFITDNNVAGVDFSISKFYTIREAIKYFTYTLILGTYSFYLEQSGTFRIAKWEGFSDVRGEAMVVGRFLMLPDAILGVTKRTARSTYVLPPYVRLLIYSRSPSIGFSPLRVSYWSG